MLVSKHSEKHVPAEEVEVQLERILTSPEFKNSKRHPRFLRYIVGKTLGGNFEEIKERSIGIEVFDRPPDYDVANDPIVRVAAGEIRKRLAQYYVQKAHEEELKVSLPPGSYVPVFSAASAHHHANSDTTVPPHHTEAETPVQIPALPAVHEEVLQAKPEAHHVPRIGVWLVVAMSIVVAGLFAYQLLRSKPLDAFWQPLLTGPSTLICIGDLNWIMPSPPPADDEPLDQLMPTRNHVGPYDVGALARVAGELGRRNRTFSVSLADSTTLTDLRTQPAVLIGALNNPWTQRALSTSRFRLERDPVTHIGRVIDTENPKQTDWSLNFKNPLAAIHRDYGLIARMPNSLTGQVGLIIAGMGPYGTTAASEFVTNSEYFQQFTSAAPTSWRDKKIEIVISTDVVDGRSGPPHLIASDIR